MKMYSMGNHSKLGWVRTLSREAGNLIAGNPVLVVVACLGFSVSFQTIAELARSHGLPGNPVIYPVLIDAGILAFIIESRRAIDARRSDLAPRLLAWALIALTLYVNAHGAPPHDWLGRALHVAGPALWAALLELTRWRKIAKRRAQESDRIPRARWLMSPVATSRMWRRMVMHNVTSYPEMVAREDARLLGIGLAAATYGKRWHRDAPPLLRCHLAAGTLPARVALACKDGSADVPELVEAWVSGTLERDRRARARATGPAGDTPAPAAVPASRRRAKGKTRPTAERVAAAEAQLPGATNEVIARRAGVAVRTVQRYRAAQPSGLYAVNGSAR